MIRLEESLDTPPAGELRLAIEALFGVGGRLHGAKGFEKRPQQEAMALGIADCLEAESPLIVEAGTGVGKSLAYLLPALRFSHGQGRKALISTHTIPLQEQLMAKDIPLALKILGIEAHVAVLKGRSHYLCPSRLKRLLRSGKIELSAEERLQVRALHEWSLQTETGERSEFQGNLSMNLWSQVCSEPFLCTARTCPGRECHYQRARQKVENAQVVVLNHALLFSLLASGEKVAEDSPSQGLLFADDFLVFDEAHTLEAIAAAHLGFQVSERPVLQWLRRLASDNQRRGLFATLQNLRGFELTQSASAHFVEFFQLLRDELPFRAPARELRLRKPLEFENLVAAPFHALQLHTENLAEEQKDDSTRRELLDLAARLRDTRQGLDDFLTQAHEGMVYWAELLGKDQEQLCLRAAPIDVAPQLRELVFRPAQPAVFTSATLSVGERELNYFRHRTGAEEVPTLELGSPFDYENQMQLLLARDIPAPQEPHHGTSLAAWVEALIEQTDGGALVLFTSFAALRDCASRITGACQSAQRPLLMQGDGMSRSRLLEKFRADSRSVLLGTESFWTGIDLPGEALRNLMITRLPFAVPDHPLTKARLEAIEEKGGKGFFDYSLPEAILKLRQGVGRLIRTTSDEGIAAILDSRVLSKPYGRQFLRALPTNKHEILRGERPPANWELQSKPRQEAAQNPRETKLNEEEQG